MKKCGLIIRVSTEEQAGKKEGSLANQPQLLRNHLEHMTRISGEEWLEARLYELKGISGKDSIRSKEFAPVFEDIKNGTVDTICCVALDRVSRSVKDFLDFFEFLSSYKAEFVSLRQNCDTSTPQGKFFVTMMIAFAELERGMTSERNREASLARAERGLWNGGHLIGHDLDPERKGNLIPNEIERVTVNFGMDKFLELGSAARAMKATNDHGFRTKGYTSRRGKPHEAKKFCISSFLHMIANPAHIGKKEINKKNKGKDQEKLPESQRYRVVDAVWEPIVDEEKFYKVQELLRKNRESGHNSAKPIKHNYVLNGGLLWCGTCGTQMEGTCGHSARGGTYYYYLCKNKACRFKAPANEIEHVVLERIKELSTRGDILDGIVRRTNERLKTELPQLRERKETLERELDGIKASAAGLLRDREEIAGEKGMGFVREQLDELGARREGVEVGIQETEQAIREIERESVSHREVTQALSRFSEVFGGLPPYKQKELVRLVVHRVELAPDSMKMALYGRVAAVGPVGEGEGVARSGISEWLPELVNR